MRRDWLHWITGGGSRNSKSATKKEAAESTSTGCMCAVFHLFHSHHLQFPSLHRNQSHSNSHSHSDSSFQEEATSTTGVEAPRNSLELVEEKLNFPVGIQIKTRSRFDETLSECNSPATKTPIVARLMGLDLLPQSPSPRCKKFSLRRDDDDVPLGARSLPETPRTSSSSRRSDVERHRLSLQINHSNNEFAPSDRSHHKMGPGRRGRFRQNENRNLMQRAVKHDLRSVQRSFGTDVTNTVVQSRRDENLLKPARKISNHNKTKLATSSSCGDYVPLLQKECKRGGFGARCGSSSRQKKLPPRGAADRAVRGRRGGEFVNRVNLRDRMQVRKFRSPSPPPTKLPQKLQVSDSLSSKCSTQLSSKPSQSYNQPPKPGSSCGGGAALHGVSSPEQRNYIQTILKQTGIINESNPLSKWHTPSHPIDPGIFRHLELSSAVSAAVGGGDTALRHQCNRKLIFQLVDELLAEILSPGCSLRRWVSHGGGCPPLAEELCKKIESFPAAKCVVLEDIDSLIDTDLCKSPLNGYFGEEEEMVREIENEVVEWLLHEAVAVMGGNAAAAEKTEAGVLYGGR